MQNFIAKAIKINLKQNADVATSIAQQLTQFIFLNKLTIAEMLLTYILGRGESGSNLSSDTDYPV
jgi:hypothetical protein